MFTRKIIVGMVVAVLLCCIGASRGVDLGMDGNREFLQEDDNLLGLEAVPEQPVYKPGEVIVKFKQPVADSLEEQIGKGKAVGTLKLSPSLEKISRKYNVKKIKPIIKNFKAKRQRMQDLVRKDKTTLTKREKHLLRRLKRAPKGAKVPDLGRIYKIELEPGQSAVQAAAEYTDDPDVEYAELNYIFSICSTEPNDPCYPVQWPLANTGQIYPESGSHREPPGTPDCDIDANEAWDIHTGSSDVIVAVVDSGVDYNHRDLVNNMWTDSNGLYGHDFLNEDNDPCDDHGHGTHCAGIIAADTDNGFDIAGVSWNTKIMAVKVGTSGKINMDAAIKGIEYAVDNGADITSNSWGGPLNPQSLKETCDYAYSQGVVMVAGAGNSNTDVPKYPAFYESVISVAATDSNDDKASFSNYGDWVDIAAPGVDILSLRADGTSMGTVQDDYKTVASGTSMACPHVAGLAALCLAEEPNLTPGDVRVLIKYYADDVGDPNIGSGRINAYSTLSNISNLPEPNKATVPYPANSATIQSFHLHLGWMADEHAATHDVYFGTDFNDVNDANTSSSEFKGNVLLSEFDPNTMDPNTTYYWRIDERNYSGCTKGDVWNFTTRGGDTIYVDIDANGNNDGTSWANAYTYLEDALYIAWDDQVWVAEGTYKPDSNDRADSFALRINTKLYGGFAGTETSRDNRDPNLATNLTILSGDIGTPNDANDNCYHVVIGNENIVLDRFTIKDGKANGSSIDIYGGGMLNSGNYSVNITDCNFTQNYAAKGGGLANIYGEVTIRGCILNDNYAGWRGGGLDNIHQATIDECLFTKNTAGIEGGGISCESSQITLKSCEFTENEAGMRGGAIYGGLMGYEGQITLTNSIFTENSADCGGAIRMVKPMRIQNLTNCTFSKNIATLTEGGGMWVAYLKPVSVKNCVFWGNDANTSGDEIYNLGSINSSFIDPNFSYCDIKDSNGSGVDWDDSIGTDGGGNIDADPCFFDANANDFHLDTNSSPCFDAGDPNYEPEDGETDIDGDDRVMNGRVDIGADELACLSRYDTYYDNWIYWGKPECWCYQRQCRGDSDGQKEGSYWVGDNDYDLFVACFNKTEENLPEGSECANFDHLKSGPFWIAIPDLNIFNAYFEETEPNVPTCEDTVEVNFWTN